MNLKCHKMIQSVCTKMAALENVGEIIKLPIILTKRDLGIFANAWVGVSQILFRK